MPAIRSLHLPSSSICLLPERTIECLSFPCLFSKFATQPIAKVDADPKHNGAVRGRLGLVGGGLPL